MLNNNCERDSMKCLGTRVFSLPRTELLPLSVVLAVVIVAGCAPGRPPTEAEWTPRDPVSEIVDAVLRPGDFRLPYGPDCNENSINDVVETHATAFGLSEARGPFPTDEPPVQVRSADFDGNGQRELLTLNSTRTDAEDGSLSLIRDTSIAANEPVTERISILDSPWVTGMVVADLDEDGDRDVAVVYEKRDYSGVIHYTTPMRRLYLNEGDGSFSSPWPVSIGNRYDDAYSLVGADVDGDRDVDLVLTRKDATVVGGLNYRVSILENLSNEGDPGVFSGVANAGVLDGFPALRRGQPTLAVADIDLDGDVELLVPFCTWSAWPTSACRAPTGIGIFTRRASGSGWHKVEMALDGSPELILVADINRDRRPDLVVSRADFDDVVVMLNDGAGEFTPSNSDYFSDPVAYAMGPMLSTLLLADLNNDGDPDIISATQDPRELNLRLNFGDGNFSRLASYPLVDEPSALVADRLGSGDFRDIAVASNAQSSVRLMWNESVAARTPDCNRNRRPDSCDIADGDSLDRDRNGVPDECPGIRPPREIRPPLTSPLPKG